MNQVNNNSTPQFPTTLAIVLGIIAISIFACKQSLIWILILILLILGLIILYRSRWIINLISPLICPQAIWAVNPRNTNNHQNQKAVALTIDDGPGFGDYTQQILGLLKGKKAHATFFIIEENVEQNETVVKEIIKQGHEIGNHMAEEKATIRLSNQDFQSQLTATHNILIDLIQDVQQEHSECAQESEIYSEVTWFRPGSAFATSEMMQIARDEYNYQTALGFVWPYDTFETYPFKSPKFSEWFIRQNVRDGSIIILHDNKQNSSRGERTVAALRLVLPQLIAQGYEIVTLSELLTRGRPVRTWLEFCTPLDKLRQRIINSLLMLPNMNEWKGILGTWTIFASIMLIIGFSTNFIQLKLVEEFSFIFFLEQLSRIFFIPSAIEELAVRASLLPGEADESNRQRDIKWSVISLIIYVFYHLPGGLAADWINNLMSRQTNYFATFTNPIFLLLTGLLGLSCTLTYLKTRSIWPSIIFHWLVVVAWLLFLGGYELLNPAIG